MSNNTLIWITLSALLIWNIITYSTINNLIEFTQILAQRSEVKPFTSAPSNTSQKMFDAVPNFSAWKPGYRFARTKEGWKLEKGSCGGPKSPLNCMD